MNERAKITASHLARHAVVYLRQSSAAQVEHNRESTERQYALASKARELGWPAERIVIIDEDLGLSGGGTATRSGFARLTAEVALARVGLVLGLEVSRLARNNAEWYRLIDLAGLTDTLIGDGDGLYHPAVLSGQLRHQPKPDGHRHAKLTAPFSPKTLLVEFRHVDWHYRTVRQPEDRRRQAPGQSPRFHPAARRYAGQKGGAHALAGLTKAQTEAKLRDNPTCSWAGPRRAISRKLLATPRTRPHPTRPRSFCSAAC